MDVRTFSEVYMKLRRRSHALALLALLPLSLPCCGSGEAAPGVTVGTRVRRYHVEGSDWSSPASSGYWTVAEVEGTRALLRDEHYATTSTRSRPSSHPGRPPSYEELVQSGMEEARTYRPPMPIREDRWVDFARVVEWE